MSQLTDIIASKRSEFEAAVAAAAADQASKAALNTANAQSAKVLLCRLITEGIEGTLDAGEQTSLSNLILRGNISLIESLGAAIERLLFLRANVSEQGEIERRNLLFGPSSVLQKESFVKAGDSGQLIHE
jgi:hypothetical protein